MKLEAFRRPDPKRYAELQTFLDELAGEDSEAPSVYELWSTDGAQIERLSFMAANKVTFRDQFNHQDVTRAIEHGVITTVGTKKIRGQPKEVQWKSSEYFSPRSWDWRVVDAQVIEVQVLWAVPPLEPVNVTFSVFGD